MLFNPNSGAAERRVKALFGLMFVVWLSAVIGIGYVLVHFVTKYW